MENTMNQESRLLAKFCSSVHGELDRHPLGNDVPYVHLWITTGLLNVIGDLRNLMNSSTLVTELRTLDPGEVLRMDFAYSPGGKKLGVQGRDLTPLEQDQAFDRWLLGDPSLLLTSSVWTVEFRGEGCLNLEGIDLGNLLAASNLEVEPEDLIVEYLRRVPVGSDELADALSMVSHDPEKLRPLINQCLQPKGQWKWEDVSAHVAHLCEPHEFAQVSAAIREHELSMVSKPESGPANRCRL